MRRRASRLQQRCWSSEQLRGGRAEGGEASCSADCERQVQAKQERLLKAEAATDTNEKRSQQRSDADTQSYARQQPTAQRTQKQHETTTINPSYLFPLQLWLNEQVAYASNTNDCSLLGSLFVPLPRLCAAPSHSHRCIPPTLQTIAVCGAANPYSGH